MVNDKIHMNDITIPKGKGGKSLWKYQSIIGRSDTKVYLILQKSMKLPLYQIEFSNKNLQGAKIAKTTYLYHLFSGQN